MPNALLVLLLVSLPVAAFAQSADRAAIIARMIEADANRDGNVSKAELVAWRTANFARFDRNRDGVLSDADIPSIVRGTSIGAQFDTLKVQFDVDRNGNVTRDEFVNGPTVMFDYADVNHDNILTKAEIAAASKGATR